MIHAAACKNIVLARLQPANPILSSNVSTQPCVVLTTIFMILNLKTDFKSFYVKSHGFREKYGFRGGPAHTLLQSIRRRTENGPPGGRRIIAYAPLA